VFRCNARRHGQWAGYAIVVSSVLISSGCGSGGPTLGKVSGNITVAGKPLDAGTVTFVSTDGQRPNATGAIKSGGSYSLQTVDPGDGAVVGDYKVAITDVDSTALNTALPGAPAAAPKSAIPSTYQDANKSGLTAKVERGSNTRNFDLKLQ